MPFGSLWLPVVVSAVAVWFVSAILHMVLKYHRADYRQLPNEEAVVQGMRAAAIPLDFSARERLPAAPAPRLGEHTEQVLHELLGMDAAEFGRLHDRGVVR